MENAKIWKFNRQGKLVWCRQLRYWKDNVIKFYLCGNVLQTAWPDERYVQWFCKAKENIEPKGSVGILIQLRVSPGTYWRGHFKMRRHGRKARNQEGKVWMGRESYLFWLNFNPQERHFFWSGKVTYAYNPCTLGVWGKKITMSHMWTGLP